MRRVTEIAYPVGVLLITVSPYYEVNQLQIMFVNQNCTNNFQNLFYTMQSQSIHCLKSFPFDFTVDIWGIEENLAQTGPLHPTGLPSAGEKTISLMNLSSFQTFGISKTN